jgi:hypothetical protein
VLRHHELDVLDLLIVRDSYSQAPAFETALPILDRRERATGLGSANAPTAGAHLLKGKFAIGPGGRGHGFAAGPATLRPPHLDDRTANRVACPKHRHDPFDRCRSGRKEACRAVPDLEGSQRG